MSEDRPQDPSSPWSTPAAPPPPPPPPVQPSYGQQPPPGYGQQQYGPPVTTGYGAPGPSTSGRATAVLICGISSLLLLLAGVGFIPAVVALVLAGGAKREILESNGRLTGLDFVKAGRICSWITVALTVLAVVFIVVAVILFTNTDSMYAGAPA